MPLSYLTTPEHFTYYIHYPPLMGILVSLSFLLFGVHEWATRLVSILASTGSVILLYLIADYLWNRRIALVASFFFAFMPLAAYFGRFADNEIITVFFLLVMFYAMLRWENKGGTAWYGLMMGSFVMAALTNWVAYFMVPLLLLSGIVRNGTGSRIRSLLLLLVFAIALGCLTLVYFWHVTGSLESLLQAFVNRSGDTIGQGARFTPPDLIVRELARGWRYFTPVVSLLSLVWVSGYVLGILQKRHLERSAPEIHLLTLFAFGLAPVIVFPQAAYIHNYYLYFLLPAMAVSAALGLEFVIQAVNSLLSKKFPDAMNSKHHVHLFLIGTVLLVFLVLAVPIISQLHSWDTRDFYEVGRYLHSHSGDQEAILTTDFIFPQTEFYTRREFIPVTDEEEIEHWIQTSPREIHLLVAQQQTIRNPSWNQSILSRYPSTHIGDWVIVTVH
jgi:4-amino-4-deoxy-L-arabinose transferase-like glycosyltransferase